MRSKVVGTDVDAFFLVYFSLFLIIYYPIGFSTIIFASDRRIKKKICQIYIFGQTCRYERLGTVNISSTSFSINKQLETKYIIKENRIGIRKNYENNLFFKKV